MQQSSGSIGNLAAALAKAQGELTNPDKSLVGTIPRIAQAGLKRRFGMRRYRAGSTLCAKFWASTKLRPCRRPPLIRLLVSSI